jgi:hypothetical protein
MDLEGFAQRQRGADTVGPSCRLAPAGPGDEMGAFGGAAGRAVAADPQQMTVRITGEQQMARFSGRATQDREHDRPHRCQRSRRLVVADLVVFHNDPREMSIRMHPDATGAIPRRAHIATYLPGRPTGKHAVAGLHHPFLIHVIHRVKPSHDRILIQPRYEAASFMDNAFRILVQRLCNPW